MNPLAIVVHANATRPYALVKLFRKAAHLRTPFFVDFLRRRDQYYEMVEQTGCDCKRLNNHTHSWEESLSQQRASRGGFRADVCLLEITRYADEEGMDIKTICSLGACGAAGSLHGARCRAS